MTITTYTDREIALQAQLAAMTATTTEYQQAADKMAMDHKVERDTLRQQLADAQALIEASRKHEAVAWMRKDGDMITALEKRPDYAYTHYYDRPLYAAQVVAPDVLKDAERYRWIREQSWQNNLCVVHSPKNSVKLGSFCPSHELLDAAIDAAMGGAA